MKCSVCELCELSRRQRETGRYQFRNVCCLARLLAASWPPVSASSAKLAAYRVPFAKNKLLVQRAIKRWGLDVTIDELQEVARKLVEQRCDV